MTDTEWTITLLRNKIQELSRYIVDQAQRIEELKADLAERRQRIDQLESTIIATQA